jgi:hypothetical protein
MCPLTMPVVLLLDYFFLGRSLRKVFLNDIFPRNTLRIGPPLKVNSCRHISKALSKERTFGNW